MGGSREILDSLKTIARRVTRVVRSIAQINRHARGRVPIPRPVSAIAAIQVIRACTAVQPVIAVAALQRVITRAAVQIIITRAAMGEGGNIRMEVRTGREFVDAECARANTPISRG